MLARAARLPRHPRPGPLKRSPPTGGQGSSGPVSGRRGRPARADDALGPVDHGGYAVGRGSSSTSGGGAGRRGQAGGGGIGHRRQALRRRAPLRVRRLPGPPTRSPTPPRPPAERLRAPPLHRRVPRRRRPPALAPAAAAAPVAWATRPTPRAPGGTRSRRSPTPRGTTRCSPVPSRCSASGRCSAGWSRSGRKRTNSSVRRPTSCGPGEAQSRGLRGRRWRGRPARRRRRRAAKEAGSHLADAATHAKDDLVTATADEVERRRSRRARSSTRPIRAGVEDGEGDRRAPTQRTRRSRTRQAADEKVDGDCRKPSSTRQPGPQRSRELTAGSRRDPARVPSSVVMFGGLRRLSRSVCVADRLFAR